MNVTILGLIIFILAFGGMVLIHEFGHFIAARLCKIEVDEFGIGLPTPGAITMFTWQGTRFTWNWLPFGGFVRPKGENDPNVPGGLAAASPWKRLIVLSAGPLMNLLAAVLLYGFIVSQAGVPVPNHVMVTGIVDKSPAAQAGIQTGDILLKGNNQPIRGYEDLRNVVDPNEGKPVVFSIDRNGQQIQRTVTPQKSAQDQRVVIGVYFQEEYTYQPVTSPFQAVQFGATATYNSARVLISMPAQLIRGSLPAEQSRLIGLKGIYDIMQQSVKKDVAAEQSPSSAPNPFEKMRTIGLIASLSISLGIFNLFPFPALDGGRIIFLLPELIFRRRVSPQVENLIHGMGMAFLLLLMIYINVMDFVNPVNITIP